MSEAEALLLDRSLRMSEPDSALEQGWLLSEMEERLGYSIDDLARSFDRSPSWVARRLSLVETLPEAVQQQVREGKIGAQIAMRYLVPVARVSLEQCLRMAAIFAQRHWTTRQAAAFYNAWRVAKGVARQRLLDNPELFLKTQRQHAPTTLESDLDKIVAIAQRALHQLQSPPANSETIGHKIQQATRLLQQLAGRIEEETPNHAEPIATHDGSGTARQRDEQTPDRAPAEPLTPERPQGAPSQLHHRAEDRPRGESRALPPADPRTIAHLQGQPRASP